MNRSKDQTRRIFWHGCSVALLVSWASTSKKHILQLEMDVW